MRERRRRMWRPSKAKMRIQPNDSPNEFGWFTWRSPKKVKSSKVLKDWLRDEQKKEKVRYSMQCNKGCKKQNWVLPSRDRLMSGTSERPGHRRRGLRGKKTSCIFHRRTLPEKGLTISQKPRSIIHFSEVLLFCSLCQLGGSEPTEIAQQKRG